MRPPLQTTLRLLFVSGLALSAVACRSSSLGACAADGDCKAGSICDRTQDMPVCVIPQSGCFPACPAGNVCRAGSCVAAGCSPACDSAHVCDVASATCVAALTAHVSVTSPAAGGTATGTLQATASAAAPGGVTTLRFELRRSATVIASAAGTRAPTSSDPTNWAATMQLAGAADGQAQLVAIAAYGAETAESAPVAVTVDQTAPAIALVTDGRTAPVAGGTTVSIVAAISDGAGSGVLDSSVKLTVGGVAVPGVLNAGQATFAVPLTDALCPPGTSRSVTFRIDAADRAGNAASLANDPKQVIRIDRDAPQITAVTVVTPPDYTAPGGKAFYANGPVPLSVRATIVDGAGIEPGSACLRLQGETSACPHPGTLAAGTSIWTFSLPRPPLDATNDGNTPVDFSVSADDTVAKTATGPLRAEHHSAGVAQHLYFDNAPPSIVIAADTAAYARVLPDGGTNLVSIAATVSDPSGLGRQPLLVSAGASYAPFSADGGYFVFQLDASDAPAGAEGLYSFSVQAQDHLGHSGTRTATRFIDDAPPAAAVKVFKDVEPASTGIGYPAAQPNTGHTGASFIYSDSVHVKGTLSDQGGLSRAVVHVDGLELDGGVSTGALRPLGCTAGATTCAFDVTVPLNAAGNGAFHTGLGTAAFGPSFIPSGLLNVVVEAQDTAIANDGSPAHNVQAAPQPAVTTRFLYQATLDGPVSGLAVHPNGQVIATTDGGVDTVYALAPDAPTPAWSYGAGAGLGAIRGPPAIGAGGATTASIYVATAGGTVLALSPSGTPVFRADGLGPFSTGPAVVNAGAGEEAVVPTNSSPGKLWAVRDASSTGCPRCAATSFIPTADADSSSAPVVLDGGVFFGTASTVSGHRLGADGTLGAAVDDNVSGPFYDLISDGQSLYAATRGGADRLIRLDQNLVEQWSIPVHSNAQPTIDIGGKLILPGELLANNSSTYLFRVDPAAGTLPTPFYDLGGAVARVPLQGSDGRIYYPRTQGYLFVLEGADLSWVFDPPNTIFRGATMDCSGRLFVASGNVVYAFVSDDHGLADTAWPNYRRDGRNSGNAGAPRYGVRTAAGCTQ